jgi:diguanylate cyclase (GGDEF)-like protein
VTEPTRTTASTDPQDRRIRRSWWFLAGSLALLGVVLVVRLATDRIRPIDVVLAGLVALVGYAALLHRNAVHALDEDRRTEAESFARILQGLSRSVSPDAIVDAIVEELGIGTDADHIVVVRRRAGAVSLEATLVSTRPGLRSASTQFPLSDLEDPLGVEEAYREPVAIAVDAEQLALALLGRGGGVLEPSAAAVAPSPLAPVPMAELIPLRPGEPGSATVASGAAGRISERIAARARRIYGLNNTLSAPLRSGGAFVGAIVLSRRGPEPWPMSTQRILAGAAVEASAALARAVSHREAETRASTDALTGLPNRRYFDEFCALLARRRRAEDAVGVLMIDVDRFKSINDARGHVVGAQVLRAVAEAIASAVREDDVPARYGGEEFAVLLRNPAPGVALEVGERVRAAVGRIDLSRFQIRRVSVSVGVAVASFPNQPIADLIEQADKALYSAKHRGRNRVVAA